MCRGRIIAFLAVLLVASGVGFAASPAASAASPQQICADLQAGVLNGNYSPADIAAYQEALKSNTLVQGYCPNLPVLTVAPPPPPQEQPCTEVSSDTAGAQLAPNGKYYNNVPAGGPEVCGPASRQTVTPPAPTPQQCVEVAAGTPGSVVAPNGKSYTNVPAGGAEVCGPAAPAKSQVVVPVSAPTQGVAAATKTKTAKPVAKTSKPVATVAPAQHSAAPLATTKTTGTLPFTGAQLTIFAITGLALLGGGILLRMTARQKRVRA
jgi:hypothetical protein